MGGRGSGSPTMTAGLCDCVDGCWTGIYPQRPVECRIKDNTNTRRRTGFLSTLNEGDDVAPARRQDPPRPSKRENGAGELVPAAPVRTRSGRGLSESASLATTFSSVVEDGLPRAAESHGSAPEKPVDGTPKSPFSPAALSGRQSDTGGPNSLAGDQSQEGDQPGVPGERPRGLRQNLEPKSGKGECAFRLSFGFIYFVLSFVIIFPAGRGWDHVAG